MHLFFAKIFTATPNLKETFNLVCAETSYSTPDLIGIELALNQYTKVR